MMQFKIDLAGNVKALEREMAKMGAFPMQVRQALWRAQEGLLQFLKQKCIEYATQEYYIKGTEVRKAITTQNYARGARYIVRGERQLLHHYKLSPTKPRKKPTMLHGAVKKSGGLKPLGRAFLMRTSGGKHIAMMREGRSRMPIRALVGPSIPQILGNYYEHELEAAARDMLSSLMSQFLQQFISSGRFERGTTSLNSADFRPRRLSGAGNESFSTLNPMTRMKVYSNV